MITVRIAGGLGNQLFQYAAALGLAERHKTQVVLDCSFFGDDSPSVRAEQAEIPTRIFLLDRFQIPAARDLRREAPLISLAGRISKSIRKKLDERKAWNERQLIIEPKADFEPDLSKAPPDAYLKGYWQSYRYFENVDALLREQLVLSQDSAPLDEALSSEIAASDSVALHVRRGDYLRKDCDMFICPPEYYFEAAAALRLHFSGLKLFVFSEDMAWCRENLEPIGGLRYVSLGSDLREFRQMSLCKHHIISNSTFSWWSAWLSANPDKRVVAPKQWYKDKPHNIRTIIPEPWQIF